MVQIIPAFAFYYPPHAQLLYIPHGSDNTQTDPRGAMNRTIFISHMVQIIPASIRDINGFSGRNFISHMVQIIPIKASEVKELKLPLYPTWFR